MMIVYVVQVDGCAKKDDVGTKNAAVLSVRRRWLVFEISVQCVTFVSDRFAFVLYLFFAFARRVE
jgi:hypothetical protein